MYLSFVSTSRVSGFVADYVAVSFEQMIRVVKFRLYK